MSEAQLRDRIEYLEAENANLRDELGRNQSDDLIVSCRKRFRISPKAAGLLVVLLDGRQHSYDSIRSTVWGDLDDAPDDADIRVHVAALRRGMRPYGIYFYSVWGHGYQMPHADCAKVHALISPSVPS